MCDYGENPGGGCCILCRLLLDGSDVRGTGGKKMGRGSEIRACDAGTALKKGNGYGTRYGEGVLGAGGGKADPLDPHI